MPVKSDAIFCSWAQIAPGHCLRLKEDLRDLRGRRLFPDRHAHTIAFTLNLQEYDLYKAVTAYINQFLPQASGRRKASVALGEPFSSAVLASSTMTSPSVCRKKASL